MPDDLGDRLTHSLRTGFIDASVPSDETLRPTLVLNRYPKTKVLSTLVKELSSCDGFLFSVAFITQGGVASLFSALQEASRKGVKGRILTTDYLSFTDPAAIEALCAFPNIQVRVASGSRFHAKGYLFFKDPLHRQASVIIGSANLTQEALSVTREWNVGLSMLQGGSFLAQLESEFQDAWDEAIEVSEAWLAHYRQIYQTFHRDVDQNANPPSTFTPNHMQQEALVALAGLRAQGKRKALVISATGTGKTFLCAFDVKAVNPRRMLFIVHRSTIIADAIKTFQAVFGSDISVSVVGDGSRETDSRFVFAMVQTLNHPEVLRRFSPDAFQYIVIDEVHHSGAETYQRVMQYFHPDFWLGMTATPQRTDGYDIYRFFDHTVAYEIQLSNALEEGMLCPFHYWGISDFTVDGQEVSEVSDFRYLVADERIVRIRQMILRYRLGNPEPRGLIFCSRNEEARELARKLDAPDMRVLSLCGSDDTAVREKAIERLKAPKTDPDHLDYLVTVDIFNEGVDIPCVNQIVMLRPTTSAIVFIQQLGRGLRLYPGKQFVSVVDFIGNYQHNYLIPVALFGDNSYEKEVMRKLVIEGSLAINGVSTVDFDHIAKERILQAVNQGGYTASRQLAAWYADVKQRCGRVPMMMDFETLNAVSPLLLIAHCKAKERSYPAYVRTVDPASFDPPFTKAHWQSLAFFATALASGKRPYEALLVKRILDGELMVDIASIKAEVQKRYGYEPSDRSVEGACNVLSDQFFKEQDRTKFGNIRYLQRQGAMVRPTTQFLDLLSEPMYRSCVSDVVAFSLAQFAKKDLHLRREGDFVLYERYTRQDACRLLGWGKDLTSTIYGYLIDYKKTRTCPVFVTYAKDSGKISASVDYQDRFESEEVFSWYTRHGVRANSKEPVAIRSGGIRMLLFVKKSDDEGSEFYYLGDMTLMEDQEETMPGKNGEALPVVHMRFRMRDPVSDAIYAYLCDTTKWNATNVAG
jgi:superfamily II DNA or RNA helicase